ncbi:aminotransferase class I/II-fold pyridoxal phosphate-dependent enzyme [Salsuginibacillus kocurii]|uniref:methionine gamma-lyase family protein n=1 Tax=Salsuginibacillus kocurii TaxID=427078 RepID=UPI00035EC938|nr:aminotransferase class V-fold PLP-dependent enzyme [Salsuginibacillus kocurii]
MWINDLTYSTDIKQLADKVDEQLHERFTRIQATVETNQAAVLRAFRHEQIATHHLQGTTGYGYDDIGREALDAIYASLFGQEDAIVRSQFISGTHAISTALHALVQPGDEIICATGTPYDTLQTVLGLSGEEKRSLRKLGVKVTVLPLTSTGYPDLEMLERVISPQTKAVAIQRSRGYDSRPSFSIQEIEQVITTVKQAAPDVLTFVDNCYGEFVEEKEPGHVGADLVAGSLIKNPGGGLARTGGYIAGNKELVDEAADILAAPGLGREGGATLAELPLMYQGLFMAPHVVGEALKGAIFTAALLSEAGFETTPHWQTERTDLIQAVHFHSQDQMVTFCQQIQRYSPIDSTVSPLPSPMPGYEDEVIMAAGTFIQGASIELSADGPVRPPFSAYVQGGLTYSHVKIAVLSALDAIWQIKSR